MRLIDADEFRRVLIERQTDAKHYEDMELRQEIGEIIEVLDKQPTAYDVDKVVVELRKESDYEPVDYDYYDMACSDEQFFIETDKAIDIVKRGDVDETNKETHQST